MLLAMGLQIFIKAPVMAVWAVLAWRRGGGVDVQVGFDPRIELTAQEISRIERIGQWEFLSVQFEVKRKGVAGMKESIQELPMSGMAVFDPARVPLR